MTGDALGTALLSMGRRSGLRLARVKITAATSTSLTVTLPDGSSIPALPVLGLTYAVNGYGTAFLAEGIVPLVLPTP
jgi:hypothetical protein